MEKNRSDSAGFQCEKKTGIFILAVNGVRRQVIRIYEVPRVSRTEEHARRRRLTTNERRRSVFGRRGVCARCREKTKSPRTPSRFAMRLTYARTASGDVPFSKGIPLVPRYFAGIGTRSRNYSFRVFFF